jgi:hypothetical protein
VRVCVCVCVRVYAYKLATMISNYGCTHTYSLTHMNTHKFTHTHIHTHTHTQTNTHTHRHTPVEEESDHGPEERVHDEIQKVPAKKGERSEKSICRESVRAMYT